MDWFEQLVGFEEDSVDCVRTYLTMEGTRLCSAVNGAAYECGTLTTPSLAELRAAPVLARGTGRIRLREVVADAQELHLDPANAGASFQVASQFNLLEMMDPIVTPEHGVTGYGYDHTQGPACAIACGAATIYRNDFVPLEGQVGQTAQRQVDCLAGLGAVLATAIPSATPLWHMTNGYALLTLEGRQSLGPYLESLEESELNTLRGRLRLGHVAGAEVTLSGRTGSQPNLVNQIFGSALPVAYGGGDSTEWEAFARLVLEASYEATLLLSLASTGGMTPKPLYLTLLGGGVFGNDPAWICSAIHRALVIVEPLVRGTLDLAIVSYGCPNDDIAGLVRDWT